MFLQQHIAQGGELDKFRQLPRDLGYALGYHLYDPVAWATLIGVLLLGLVLGASRQRGWPSWLFGLALLALLIDWVSRFAFSGWGQVVPLPTRGDGLALAVAGGVAWYVGHRIRWRSLRGSADRP
jgi:hypothetical protein